MSIAIVIFIIIAVSFALASLAFVAVDIVIEQLRRKEIELEVRENVIVEPAPAPVVIAVQPEAMPDIVDQIKADEADALISDSLAMKQANYESGAGHGKQGIINIGLLSDKFSENDVITLGVLKTKGLVPKNVGRMKILADGVLSKPLTIKAESYSIQAIKMIELTGGTVIILKD